MARSGNPELAHDSRFCEPAPRAGSTDADDLGTRMSSCFKCDRYSVPGGTTLTSRTAPVKSARKSLAYGSFGYQSSTRSNRQPYGRKLG
jgi:hypothetical protein